MSASDRHLMVLTHEGPNGRVFYISDALPFGARGSVFSFLRTSRALSFLMNVGMMIPGAVFFDNFPCVTETSSAGSAFDGPHTLLDALGWLYAEDSDKCKPFGSCFDVLGCRLDLTHLTSGNLVLANREGRLESIQSMVERMKSEDNPRSLIPVVQGLSNFASGFIMGRALQPLAKSLSWQQDPNQCAELCDSILATLGECKPRSLSWHSPHHPILLFTDAAFKDGIAGIGAVLVDTLGGKPEVYDGEIPAELIRHWQATGQQQVISQAELAVVVAMCHMLKERLSGRRVLETFCIYFSWQIFRARLAFVRNFHKPGCQNSAKLFRCVGIRETQNQEAGRQHVDTPFLCFVQRVSSVSRFIENNCFPAHA